MSKQKTIEKINIVCQKNMVKHLGIEVTDYGSDFICAKMAVDERTKQPFGLLHGGASAVLAETLGSIGGGMLLDDKTKTVVGVEINCSHLKSVSSGWVFAKAKAIKIGRKLHIWAIDIKNEQDELICISRLTLAVVERT